MKIALIFLFILIAAIFFWAFSFSQSEKTQTRENDVLNITKDEDGGGLPITTPHPLSIAALRNGKYPGSTLVEEEKLENGSNYKRSIVSYKSEGNKIFALLTVPVGQPPTGGWPVIIFNHGYIPPREYRTTESYIAYVDGFARNGYIVFRSDYRGHGSSEGTASGGYGNNDYTIDILNAVASVKKLSYINKEKIGMWGHSMGGHITLRNMVVNKDVKAGVIWAGVVASYPDLVNNWRRPIPSSIPRSATSWRSKFTEEFGTPEENPDFWNSISSDHYLSDISGPIQIHHGTNDESVPHAFSEKLQDKAQSAGKISELYIYEGDDHNLSQNFNTAMNRSIAFFDKYLKD